MYVLEKVRLKEKKIMTRAKVKVLRLTGTAEGGRTAGTVGTGCKVVQPCGVHWYSTGVSQVTNAILCHVLGHVGKICLEKGAHSPCLEQGTWKSTPALMCCRFLVIFVAGILPYRTNCILLKLELWYQLQ